MGSKREQAAFVLVETGALAPRQIDLLAPQCRTTLTIVQHPDEEPGAFMQRAFEELAKLEQAGVAIAAGVVACNERTDPHQLASRELFTHALASAISRADGKRLTLCGSSCATPATRISMLELMHQLADARPQLTVGIRFEPDGLVSGPPPFGRTDRRPARIQACARNRCLKPQGRLGSDFIPG